MACGLRLVLWVPLGGGEAGLVIHLSLSVEVLGMRPETLALKSLFRERGSCETVTLFYQ